MDKPYELSKEDELNLEKNIVWVFASTRSGTTWLGPQLLTYNTLIMDEPRINLHLGIHASGMPIGVSEIEVQEKRTDYFFCSEYKDTWNYFLRKLILNRIYSQFQELSKKIIIKEPTAGEIGNITITQCLPNSKIIWLVRDGRDVIDSQVDAVMHGYSKGGRLEGNVQNPLKPEQRLEFISGRSRLWIKIMEKIETSFGNHPNESKILVRYENLRKDTFRELKKIYDFLKIDINDDEIEKLVDKFKFENIPKEQTGPGKKTRIAKPGNWEKNFSNEEKILMNSIMEDTLKKLDYIN